MSESSAVSISVSCWLILLVCSGVGFTDSTYAQPNVATNAVPLASVPPEDCNVPPQDLVAPDLPPGTDRVVRIVSVNGYYRPELSTGSMADLRLAKLSVEPRRGGYRWGPKCRGTVKFFFLAAGDQPSNDEVPVSGTPKVAPSAPVTSPSSMSTEPAPNWQDSADLPPALSPQSPSVSDQDTSADTRTMAGGRKDDPCPPPGGAVNSVMLERVRFLVQRCSSVTSSCAATASPAGASGDCVTKCRQWSPPSIQGAPLEGETIGLILQDGERISWNAEVAKTARFKRIEYPDTGEEIHGPILERAQFSNGVTIREVEYGRFSAEVPVSLLGSRSTVSQNATDGSTTNSRPARSAPPVSRITLNGKATFEHLWYTGDGGKFVLRFTNQGSGQSPADSSESGICPPSGTLVVHVVVKTLDPFFTGVVSQTFTLVSGASRNLTGTVDSLLQAMTSYQSDILLGARIEIRTWDELQPAAFIDDFWFGVYRFLDVADDKHADGTVEMARTLSDGKNGVVRQRKMALRVHPEAAVQFDSDDPSEFQVRVQQELGTFRFDPPIGDVRQQYSGRVILSSKSPLRRIGTLAMKGTGEPQNRILFNEGGFEKTLAGVLLLAKEPGNSSAKPPHGTFGHPALIPKPEWLQIESRSQRDALGLAIRRQMQLLWSEAGLLQGIRWTSSADLNNTIEFRYSTFDNRKGFPRAKSIVENQAAIFQDIIRKRHLWSKPELAFRLSQAINPGLRATIDLWPDSILEGVPPLPDNRVSQTSDQMARAFAKTMVHEIGHTWSLDHPVKTLEVGNNAELQKLVLADEPINSNRAIRLAFHGETTRLLPLIDPDDTPAKRVFIRPGTIRDALIGLPSIGVENFLINDRGVTLYSCGYLVDRSAWNEADLRAEEIAYRENLVTLCQQTDLSEQNRTIFMRFSGHLSSANVDPIEIQPADGGTVTTVTEGSRVEELLVENGQPALLDGYMVGSSANTIFDKVTGDVMAQSSDVSGEQRFLEGLSLEAAKMALALNYTSEEVETVVALYAGLDAAYRRFGKLGFER